jgi:peptide/nickel transport system permease protein
LAKILFKRLFTGFLVLIAVIVIISSIIYLAPVDPTRLSFGQRSDVQTVEQKKKELGLDQALYIQLLFYLRDISPFEIARKRRVDTISNFICCKFKVANLTFLVKKPNLRSSFQTGRPVIEILKEAIPKTLLLAFSAMFFATLIGIVLGVIAALKKDTWIDSFLIGFSTLGYSLPSYVTAIILAVTFGYYFGEWTGLNIQGSIVELNELGDEVIVWKNLVLPSIALGIRPIAIITQLTRSAMLDELSKDYVRTAKSKGLSLARTVRKHAFRNALNPVTTAITGWFAALLAGAFFVENVFNFKGLGEITVTALINYDIPVVLGAVIFSCMAFVIINILVDFLYVLIDPKIRL